MPSWSLPISVRLHSWLRQQGDCGVVRRRVHHAIGHVDAVRAAVGRVVVVPPEDLPGGKADRHHVRIQVLDVHHTVHHHRRGRVGTVRMRGDPEGHGPRHAQLQDVRAGDRAGDVPGIGQVAARQRPARRGRPPGLPGRLARSRRGGRAARRARPAHRRGLGRARRRTRAAAASAAADGQPRGHHQGHAAHRGPPVGAGRPAGPAASRTPQYTHDCLPVRVPPSGAHYRPPASRWSLHLNLISLC